MISSHLTFLPHIREAARKVISELHIAPQVENHLPVPFFVGVHVRWCCQDTNTKCSIYRLMQIYLFHHQQTNWLCGVCPMVDHQTGWWRWKIHHHHHYHHHINIGVSSTFRWWSTVQLQLLWSRYKMMQTQPSLISFNIGWIFQGWIIFGKNTPDLFSSWSAMTWFGAGRSHWPPTGIFMSNHPGKNWSVMIFSTSVATLRRWTWPSWPPARRPSYVRSSPGTHALHIQCRRENGGWA